MKRQVRFKTLPWSKGRWYNRCWSSLSSDVSRSMALLFGTVKLSDWIMCLLPVVMICLTAVTAETVRTHFEVWAYNIGRDAKYFRFLVKSSFIMKSNMDFNREEQPLDVSMLLNSVIEHGQSIEAQTPIQCTVRVGNLLRSAGSNSGHLWSNAIAVDLHQQRIPEHSRENLSNMDVTSVPEFEASHEQRQCYCCSRNFVGVIDVFLSVT